MEVPSQPQSQQQQEKEGPLPPPPPPPSSLTLVDESISLSIRCGGRGEDELLVAIGRGGDTVKVHEAFLRATFKRAAKGTNLRLLDQRGRMHHPVVYPPPSSCQCHGEEAARRPPASPSYACFELPQEGLCYELLFDKLDDEKEKEEPKQTLLPLLFKEEDAAAAAGLGGGKVCRAAAPLPRQQQQQHRRLDLSGGEHGEGGHRMYIAPNGTRVVSSVPADEGCGIANLFSQSRGKYYFRGTAGGRSGGHLTFEFPWPVRVTRVAIRSHVPGLGAVDTRGGNVAAPVLPHRCRSNYSVLLWEKGICGGSWTEAVPLVDTADHPAPGIETVHDASFSSQSGDSSKDSSSGLLIDRLRIFLTSEGDDAGVALGSVAIYIAAPSSSFQ